MKGYITSLFKILLGNIWTNYYICLFGGQWEEPVWFNPLWLFSGEEIHMQENKGYKMPKTWVQNSGSLTRPLGSQEMSFKRLFLGKKKKKLCVKLKLPWRYVHSIGSWGEHRRHILPLGRVQTPVPMSRSTLFWGPREPLTCWWAPKPALLPRAIAALSLLLCHLVPSIFCTWSPSLWAFLWNSFRPRIVMTFTDMWSLRVWDVSYGPQDPLSPKS